MREQITPEQLDKIVEIGKIRLKQFERETAPPRKQDVSDLLGVTLEILEKSAATIRAQATEIARLKQILSDCRIAIQTLPEDALGQDERDGYYYRDELLSNINHATEGSPK